MPFTGAHPLVIAPLVRLRWLDPTSLVIGSMAPDFQYFMYGHERGSVGHSMLGLAIWCIPVVLIIGLLFHHVVKWPLLVAMPRGLARRLATSAAVGWPMRPIPILASAVIGGASHDLWDSFTHADGLFVHQFPVLTTPVHVPWLGIMVIHRILQYACSVVGLVGVAWLLARAVKRRAPVELPELPAWRARAVLAVGAVLGSAFVLWRVARFLEGPSSIVVACISGTIYGLVVSGLALWDVGLRARSVSGGRDTTSPWPA